jgi:putative transposase
MATPDFAVHTSRSRPAFEPFGLLESLPTEAVTDAERWCDHLIEVETGLPPGTEPCTPPRSGYDPVTTTLADRQRAKAAELGVSVRTIEGKRGPLHRAGPVGPG